MEIQKQTAARFLLYTYFNLSVSDAEDQILDRAMEKAYTDATNEGAYNTRLYDDIKAHGNEGAELQEEKNNRKTKSASAKKQAKQRIKDFVGRLASVSDDKQYDTLHRETCCDIISIYEEALGVPGLFTYGNAQKWVNMTTKYLYLLCGAFSVSGKDLALSRGVENCKAYLHVPIDSYIMEAIYKDIQLPVRDGSNMPFESMEKVKYSTAQNHLKPWSSWTETEYKSVFDEIRMHALREGSPECALVWENDSWIKIAKSRKKK